MSRVQLALQDKVWVTGPGAEPREGYAVKANAGVIPAWEPAGATTDQRRPVPQTRAASACSVLDAPVTAGEVSVLAGGLAALAGPARLRLLSLVTARPEACT